LPGELFVTAHRREESFLDKILRDFRLAHPFERVAIKHVTVFVYPALRVGRCDSSCATLDNSTLNSTRLKGHPGGLREAGRIVKKKCKEDRSPRD
jgi:hypothetical protein